MKAKPTTTAATITERRERESVCVCVCVGKSEIRVGVLSLFCPLHSPRLLKARYAYKQTNTERERVV